MNKSEKRNLIILFIMVYLLIASALVGMYIIIQDENIEKGKRCNEAGLESNCHFKEAECGIDCKYMDMEFHHYRGQSFGADDCFCKDKEGEVKSMW